MKDALERRALLLELGDVLRMLAFIQERVFEPQTIDELVHRYAELAEVPLLEQVAQSMTVSELQYRTLRAFCEWPQRLLDTPLDRAALASPVRELLFDDNPMGWEAYAGALGVAVPWFGAAARVPAAV